MKNNPVDKLFICNLRVPVQVGILPHEKTSKQIISLDLTFGIDSKRATASDDIASTVDYAAVREQLIQFLHNKRFGLIETLANQCAEWLLTQFNLTWLRMRVTKTAVFDDVDGVGIIIERSRETQ